MLVHPSASGRTAEIFEYSDGRVLKLFRAGWSRKANEHEAHVARIVAAGGFAPKTHWNGWRARG